MSTFHRWIRNLSMIAAIAALFGMSMSTTAQTQAPPSAKSPKQAFIRSLLIPGWGEFYSGAKYRAAGFLGAEALTWLAWANWRSKGADLRAEFRLYADQYWSLARYESWRAYNADQPTPAQYFETETLPTKAEDIQQYYELVGKYKQFIYGWEDLSGEPLSVNNLSIESNLQEQYETMRNESNKNLKRASVIIGLTVVNRIISAVHASAYTRQLSTAETRRVWVGLVPFSPHGGEGVTASLTTSF